VNDWGIIGHDWAVRRLQSAIASGQLAQSHLFVGPPAIGKATLARATARAVLGRDERTRALVDAMRHPDLSWVQPDGDSDSIKVEPVRELLHTLTLAPVESRHRVAVIDQAHLITDSGKNAILKTLEEPNPSVVIILIAPSVESVLPTISSRCQVLNLRPVPVSEIKAALRGRGVASDRAAFIARLSRGRVGWALRAIEDETVLEERKQRLDDLLDLMTSNHTKRFTYAEKLARADSSEVEATLNEWLLFWRDVTRLAGGESNADLLNADYRDDIARIAESVDPVSASAMLRGLSETMQHIDRNVNTRLALDVLLLKMPSLPSTLKGEFVPQ
jgi:DNA polymerase-3 subunit delta'